jgi:hypothetical protein
MRKAIPAFSASRNEVIQTVSASIDALPETPGLAGSGASASGSRTSWAASARIGDVCSESTQASRALYLASQRTRGADIPRQAQPEVEHRWGVGDDFQRFAELFPGAAFDVGHAGVVAVDVDLVGEDPHQQRVALVAGFQTHRQQPERPAARQRGRRNRVVLPRAFAEQIGLGFFQRDRSRVADRHQLGFLGAHRFGVEVAARECGAQFAEFRFDRAQTRPGLDGEGLQRLLGGSRHGRKS